MSVTESTYQVKTGIESAIDAVLAADSKGGEVAVFWGEPPPSWPREFVCVMNVEADLDAATMGTNRTRDEMIRQQINIVVHKQGAGSQKQSADRAYGLLSAIETHIRTVAPTLGVDGCLWCFLTRISETGGTPPADRPAGRYTEIVAEFTAKIRITK